MLIVGLTGGIGTGKSTAAEFFIKKGFAHIDADQIGRDLTADGKPMVYCLNAYFGPKGPYGKPGVEILKSSGVLDRKAMADVVFQNEDKLAKFNKLMHTAIIDEITNRIDEITYGETGQGKVTGILIDAPLLFEAGVDQLCDVVILIIADMEQRIRRVCERDNATRQEVQQRIDNQMEEQRKIQLADYVVDNSSTKDELFKNLKLVTDSFLD